MELPPQWEERGTAQFENRRTVGSGQEEANFNE